MGIFDHIGQAIHGTLATAAGESVTYNLTGPQTGNGITEATIEGAIKTNGRQRVENDQGVLITVKTIDFLVAVEAFELVGISRPRRGDLITLANGRKFKVIPPAQGEKYYYFRDHAESLYRIHTQEAKA